MTNDIDAIQTAVRDRYGKAAIEAAATAASSESAASGESGAFGAPLYDAEQRVRDCGSRAMDRVGRLACPPRLVRRSPM
jgi:hypothetical protein